MTQGYVQTSPKNLRGCLVLELDLVASAPSSQDTRCSQKCKCLVLELDLVASAPSSQDPRLPGTFDEECQKVLTK